MSDEKALAEMQEKMAQQEKFEVMKNETAKKQAIINSKRATSTLEKIAHDQKDIAIAKKANYGSLTAEQIEYIQKENDDYIIAAKTGMQFINKEFSGVVPFFRKNFILVGAKTGEGKSTAVANIAYSVIKQRNPKTGKPRRVLVLTNEERAEDVYNRITALARGWHYTNHSEFTDEQINTFRDSIKALGSNGLVTVIDNTHGGSHGVTTSIDGIETVFDTLIANNEIYDVVLIDYYQNIIHSKKDPTASENEVQARLTRMIDKYKNIYPAPIVMMAQMNAPDEDDRTPYQYRIKGRKIIADAATFVIEMAADRQNKATQWTVWKSRFTESVGKVFHTGYENGKFVEYSDAFRAKVQEEQDRRRAKEIDKTIGLPDVFEDKNGKED